MKAALNTAHLELELLARADAGEALHAIAASLGIPEHRVRSIVQDAAPPPDPDAPRAYLPPKPRRVRRDRPGPPPAKTEAARAWILAHPTKRAVIAARETGVSYAIAQRARRELHAAGKVPEFHGRPRKTKRDCFEQARIRGGHLTYWLDEDVCEEMRAEAARTGMTVSEVAQAAWKRARRALRRRRAP